MDKVSHRRHDSKHVKDNSGTIPVNLYAVETDLLMSKDLIELVEGESSNDLVREKEVILQVEH